MPGADAESAELQPAADPRQPYRKRRSQMEIQGCRGEDAQCETGEPEVQELPVYLPGAFPGGLTECAELGGLELLDLYQEVVDLIDEYRRSK